MSKKAYSQDERQRIRAALIQKGAELFICQGMQKTTLPQIYGAAGISKTFFYSFFSGKEELFTEVLYAQQPRVLQCARQLMTDCQGDWKTAMARLLRLCCYGERHGFAILSMEEEKDICAHISHETFLAFREQQKRFFKELLAIFGIHPALPDICLAANLFLSAAIMRKAIPESAPFLFSEEADRMTEFQLSALLQYMERLRSAPSASVPD